MKVASRENKIQAQSGESPAAIMARQREGFRDLEIPQDVQFYGEKRAQVIDWLNRKRAKIGMPPLVNDEIAHPELAEERRLADEHYRSERAKTQQGRRVSRGIRNA